LLEDQLLWEAADLVVLQPVLFDFHFTKDKSSAGACLLEATPKIELIMCKVAKTTKRIVRQGHIA
jgi:hypothetical protein